MSKVEESKDWFIKVSDGVLLKMRPLFLIQDVKAGEVNATQNKDVECAMIKVTATDASGREMKFDLPYQEIFMLIYFCANEELRQALYLRNERKVTEIPYEVTFRLSKDEITAGMAKRLIKLPVDELTMAAVRAEAQMSRGVANLSTVNDWFKKRIAARERSNKLKAS